MLNYLLGFTYLLHNFYLFIYFFLFRITMNLLIVDYDKKKVKLKSIISRENIIDIFEIKYSH